MELRKLSSESPATPGSSHPESTVLIVLTPRLCPNSVGAGNRQSLESGDPPMRLGKRSHGSFPWGTFGYQ